jgi:hypothetical protein
MGRMKLPCFDGRMENYDKWETEWAAFAEEEGLCGALGDCRDTNMPDSSVVVVGKDAAGKLQAAAVKTNKRAMAYLALAFDTMRLLRLIIKAKSEEWPEGEAWKVMQFLKKKYCPDRVGLRKMIVKEEETNKNVEEKVAEEEQNEEHEESNAEKDFAEEELSKEHAEEEVRNENEVKEEYYELAEEEATEERKEAAAEECEEAEEVRNESEEEVRNESEEEVRNESEEEVRDESEEEVRNENEVKEEYYELAEEELCEEEDDERENSNAEKDVAEEEPEDKHAEEEVRNESEELYYELDNGEGCWMLGMRARRPGRESEAIMMKAVKKKKNTRNVGCVRVQSHNGRVSEVSCENCTHTAIAAKKKGCYAQRDSGRVWTTPVMSGQGSRWDTKGMYEGENTAVI